MIGSGSFSSVYKGIMEEYGNLVAIKVLKLHVKGASKTFLAECEALRQIKHRNLVKLLTSCSSIDYQGNDFRALIYEYMANGNLGCWLHQRSTNSEENQEPKSLNMLQRLNIVIDVATALDYLHHQSGTPLTHCDIKPNNVLLDEDFVAHLGDFGLARFLPDATHLLSLSQSSSLNVRGTIGYVPPESARGNTFSTYGNVYGYGILLLETFTGKSPTDEIFKDGLELHNFVKRAIPERVKDVSDPKLLYVERGTLINTNEIVECLSSIFQIGIACSVESAKDRMDISNVVNELTAIKLAFLRQ